MKTSILLVSYFILFYYLAMNDSNGRSINPIEQVGALENMTSKTKTPSPKYN
jgi:hypothetical protein